jgi:hypothetical protein
MPVAESLVYRIPLTSPPLVHGKYARWNAAKADERHIWGPRRVSHVYTTMYTCYMYT